MSQLDPIFRKLRALEDFLKNDVPHIVGVEAQRHFRDSFRNQGFTDKGLKKWPEVKRRKADSSWYGFKYGSKTKRPGRKRKKPDSITNYSPSATKRPILTGDTMELQNSITYRVGRNKVVLISDKKYAKPQNEGASIRVFGKSSAKLPARKFMGNSHVLVETLRNQFITRSRKILD